MASEAQTDSKRFSGDNLLKAIAILGGDTAIFYAFGFTIVQTFIHKTQLEGIFSFSSEFYVDAGGKFLLEMIRAPLFAPYIAFAVFFLLRMNRRAFALVSTIKTEEKEKFFTRVKKNLVAHGCLVPVHPTFRGGSAVTRFFLHCLPCKYSGRILSLPFPESNKKILRMINAVSKAGGHTLLRFFPIRFFSFSYPSPTANTSMIGHLSLSRICNTLKAYRYPEVTYVVKKGRVVLSSYTPVLEAVNNQSSPLSLVVWLNI